MNCRVIFGAICIMAGGCTWVKPAEQAENVRIAEAVSEIQDCKRLGATNVAVKHKVTFVTRDEDTVGRELETLARNEAAQMGGNVVLSEGEVEEGRQRFGIYACP